MSQFELGAELHERLCSIREGVRDLFDQLRLRSDDRDISGKDRLERVPALQKRNFRNLTGPSSRLAIREAWRLVDFLEGAEQERLSVRAREALRIVELDHRLAALRASGEWKEAAAALRQALGCIDGSARPGPASPKRSADHRSTQERAEGAPAGPSSKRRGLWVTLACLLAAALLALVVGRSFTTRSTDRMRSCLALEHASGDDVAAHRTLFTIPPTAGAPARPSGEAKVLTARDGTHVASTWTTSYFSFEEPVSRPGKGGGRSDMRLRVGGWGDTYVSLIRFELPDDRLAYRATLQLVPLAADASFRPTPMSLRAIHGRWAVRAEPGHRLWWADCPLSEAIETDLPPPGRPGTPYRVDITPLYNNWVSGQQDNHGIMLEPERIARGGEHALFNTFHSSRARNEANRPKIVVEY